MCSTYPLVPTDYWVAGAVPALLPSPHSQADSHVLGHPLLPWLRSQRVGTPLRRSHKADFEHLKLASVPRVFLMTSSRMAGQRLA